MAACFQLEQSVTGTQGSASGQTLGLKPLPWYMGEATQSSAGQWTCATGTHLLLTPTELNKINGGPFVMSVADGATLSMLIIGVWVSAWAFKAFGRVVDQSHDGD